MSRLTDSFRLTDTQVAGKYAVDKPIGGSRYTVVYDATHISGGAATELHVFKALDDFTPDQREALLQSLIHTGVEVGQVARESPHARAPREIGPLTLSDGSWVPYIAFDSLDAVALDEVQELEREHGLPSLGIDEAMRLLDGVADALAAAHDRGVVHGGVAPRNVLVVGEPRTDEAYTVLSGFGVERALSEAREGGGPLSSSPGATRSVFVPCYHPRFAAPEQVDFTGGTIGAASDVFSLALLLVSLISPSADAPDDAPRPPADRRTPRARGVHVDDALEAVLTRALASDASVRPKDAGELWSELRVAAGMQPHSLVAAPTLPLADDDSTPAMSRNADPIDADATDESPIVNTPTHAPARPRTSRNYLIAAGIGVALAATLGVAATRAGRRDTAPSNAAMATPVDATNAATASSHANALAKPAAPCPDGMVFVEGGRFFMGSDDDAAMAFEKPAHNVTLSAYCIDKNEVTVAQYKACSDDGHCLRASKSNEWKGISAKDRKLYDPLCNANDPSGRADHPVNCVNWKMAHQYCREQGKRLPTEAEWEYAARGRDGRVYPWGDDPPDGLHLNACGTECAKWGEDRDTALEAMHEDDDGWAHTAPVGSYPKGASPFGLNDTVGNVWEWVGDWYQEYADADAVDPGGPSTGDKRVIRGGGWNGARASWVRPTFRYRDTPQKKSHGIGFRCAMVVDHDRAAKP